MKNAISPAYHDLPLLSGESFNVCNVTDAGGVVTDYNGIIVYDRLYTTDFPYALPLAS